jgi:hypothetical protein
MLGVRKLQNNEFPYHSTMDIGAFVAEDTLLTSSIEYAILFTYERSRSYVNNCYRWEEGNIYFF